MSVPPPPIRSMTGFGAASGSTAGFELRIEIRSVNHRHLVAKLALGSRLQVFEAEVERRVRERVQRGSLVVQATCDVADAAPRVRFRADIAARYREDLAALAASLRLTSEPGLDLILGLPGVVEPVSAEPGGEELFDLVAAVVDEALDALITSRDREGAAIALDLERHIGVVEAAVDAIIQRGAGVFEEYRSRLERRVLDFLAEHGLAAEHPDVLREVALFADRVDIDEELSRLRTHVGELRRVVAEGGTVGRTLDFLVQEMMREANTIGAKSADAELAHRVVEIKTGIDRIREQVQNLE